MMTRSDDAFSRTVRALKEDASCSSIQKTSHPHMRTACSVSSPECLAFSVIVVITFADILVLVIRIEGFSAIFTEVFTLVVFTGHCATSFIQVVACPESFFLMLFPSFSRVFCG
jgi:hypothetical protein